MAAVWSFKGSTSISQGVQQRPWRQPRSSLPGSRVRSSNVQRLVTSLSGNVESTNLARGRVQTRAAAEDSESTEETGVSLNAKKTEQQQANARKWRANVSSKGSDTQSQASGLSLLDAALGRGSEVEAVQLARQFAENRTLEGFGSGKLVPKRLYTYEELLLKKVNPEAFLNPDDATLEGVRSKLLGATLLSLGLITADQIGYGGGAWNLVIDTLGRTIEPKYSERVSKHEAGHFLTAYLLGVLPKSYTLSSLDAFSTYRQLNVQAGTVFCDKEFQEEISTGKLSSDQLDKFCCVALAGIAAETLCFPKAEGGKTDVIQLDLLLRAIGFEQSKATAQVRWAVLATVSLLRRYRSAHLKLAAAMDEGRSVGGCIAVIEAELKNTQW